jgi:O-antigen/teichoic acid export membrane protein
MWDLHRRARRGIRLLLLRQALVQLLAFAASVVVARMLAPAEFGLFCIAIFVVNALALVTDCGMKPALIRRAAAVTERQLTTSFTLRLALVTLVVLLLWLAAPSIVALYPGAPPELGWLVRVCALDLYLRAWRAVSEIRLERELRYEHFAVIDVAGSVVHHAVAIGLLVLGWGVRSLVLALLVASLLRTGLLYRARPWRVRLGLDPAAARELVRAGLPLQASQAVNQAQNWVTPTVVGVLAGPEAVGLLNWASGNGRKPLEAVENVVRVSLPHFSRLQDDEREVERVLARYVLAFLLLFGLWFAVLAVAGRDLVRFIYTERWLPAVPALVLYAAHGALSAVRWVTTTALVALGRVRVAAPVTVVASMLSFLLSVVLALHIGLLGVPIGQLLGALLAVPWLLSWGFRPPALGRVLGPARPVAGAVVAAGAVGAAALLVPLAPAVRGLVTAALMTSAYAAVAWWAGPAWLRATVREELVLPARQLGESGYP